ncbi:GNAT family N-acetyltransferase [Curtobacterium sp. CFBP9011]|uniref:GNAT family N-acetyltransferase n=1 Tax=Curtobacterium sp. CFBP9011 TaxID=3096530 RepID=UPI002A6A8FC6|nr:GNAT family N-acetyltransferase [Curtobacterium sp. CFBP9011]MDY1006313.1 GNAT family N-acetyltransferase [Curtobacterium sp. CFBP9011]
MNVRAATKADLDILGALSVEIQRLHEENRPDLFRAPDEGALRSFLADQLARGAVVLVADHHGTAAGYLLAELSARPASPFRHASKSLYVHHIAVAPTAQRQGIGEQLIEAAVAIAQAESAQAVRLDSWSFNRTAHAFFEGQGFEPVNVVFERQLR